MRQLQNDPEKNQVFLPRTIAQIRRLTVYLLMDLLNIVEARDEISMAALCMSAGALGNARTQTLRAFSETEIKTSSAGWPDRFAFALRGRG